MLCSLCPNACRIDRSVYAGACGEKDDIRIAKYYLHPYEEPIISGKNGSGTIFFVGCSLKCAFCQNYELSRSARGKTVTEKELAEIFKELEREGAHNINLVSPTHFSDRIVRALTIYRPNIPIVWNTHGYDTIENLKFIDPYVDIYLTDLKYFSPKRAERYAKKPDYFEVAFKAVKYMIASKKSVVKDGLMQSGVIVRHLILPQNSDETRSILTALRPEIGDAYLSLMAQYTPFGDLSALPELKRTITRREYDNAVKLADELSYEHTFTQEFDSQSTSFIPEWDY